MAKLLAATMKAFVPKSLPYAEIAWEEHVSLLGQANRALALYDGILHGVLNPMVMLSPLTTQEAVLSSKIEGTQATLGEVLKFEAGAEITGEQRREDIHEILNYRKALREAERELKTRPFSLNLLKRMHAVLLDSVRGRDKARGEFRTTQNYIGKPGTPIEQAYFVPPEPQHLMQHLDIWEKYYHADERDPLVQLALLHAQFEIIHPFMDGNGRIGRILIPLFLCEKKILSRPMFYLSAYLESHRDEYVGLLRALNGAQSWNHWIAFFLRALVAQAAENADKARAILRLYEDLKARILELTHSQYAIPLLDRLFGQPIFASSDLIGSKKMPSKPMVMYLLRRLREAGILKVVHKGGGPRPQILCLAELVNLCEGKKLV